MPTLVIAVTAIVLAILERIPGVRRLPLSLFRRFFLSDVFYLLSGFVAGTSLALAYLLAMSKWLGIPELDAPLWMTIPIALVLIDLANYLCHFLLHRVDALWELHKVHHSSRALDWLATFRSHILEQVVRRMIIPIPLVLAGVPLPAILIAVAIFNAWGMLNHANLELDLRFLEPVFVTPRLHRYHHNPGTSDHNFGVLFSFWDRLRGRLITDGAIEVLGVPDEVETYPQSWWPQLFEPARRVFSSMPRTDP